jgi:ABC-type antimicrobial peptide transport system permease subunit
LIALTFAGLAVALAATGVYGLVAYLVQQRVREMAIRLALGADARRVRNLILGDGLRLAAGGIAIGLAGALGATRLIAGLLFEVTARDPGVLAVSAALLCLVALLSVWLPARQASRVDPAIVLRTE